MHKSWVNWSLPLHSSLLASPYSLPLGSSSLNSIVGRSLPYPKAPCWLKCYFQTPSLLNTCWSFRFTYHFFNINSWNLHHSQTWDLCPFILLPKMVLPIFANISLSSEPDSIPTSLFKSSLHVGYEGTPPGSYFWPLTGNQPHCPNTTFVMLF